ncbi:O-methyltransferase [Fulvivirga sp. M361]|uniref:O-methyltransferase n=1 Tax=Fulvivirga sp. M361 TaxID=2594266 RepID=UPI00117B6305|nr:O-methyltransferase [Fulvivirga sp. M361]TRX59378.1 O-methyltransferase [Fulvivirga sp. M361]
MEFINKDIQNYAELHTEPESRLLHGINRDTHANVIMPRMLSGHLQGRVLSMLSHMIRPKYILEIGTYTGYSALCLAEGMQSEGRLVTIDVNEELEDRVRHHLEEAGILNKVVYKIGNALDIIPTLDYTFDLVFIDADKINYSNYFDLVIEKMNKGGYIIADNVLWSGKVLDEKKDKDTQGIDDFNKKVHNDSRVQNVLFPIRDGLMITRKL